MGKTLSHCAEGITDGVLTRPTDGCRESTAIGIFSAWAIGCSDWSLSIKQVWSGLLRFGDKEDLNLHTINIMNRFLNCNQIIYRDIFYLKDRKKKEKN